VALRRERFARLPDSAVAYERGAELHEGLAHYVERRAAEAVGGAARPPLAEDEFPADAVRRRCYAAGRGLALLLDRVCPDWKARLEGEDGQSPDELLAAALAVLPEVRVAPARKADRPGQMGFSSDERAAALARAAADVERLLADRARERQSFFAQAGWTVEVVAGEGAPLQCRGFDPMNVRRLPGGEVLHTRWLQLGNAAGEVEVLGGRALTEPAGAHPLFTGVRRLVVAGLGAEPRVQGSGGSGGGAAAISLCAHALTGELRGARVVRDPRQQRLRVELPDA